MNILRAFALAATLSAPLATSAFALPRIDAIHAVAGAGDVVEVRGRGHGVRSMRHERHYGWRRGHHYGWRKHGRR